MKVPKYLLFTIYLFILGSCETKPVENTPEVSLKDSYADFFRIGTAVTHLITNGMIPETEEILLTHFNSVTAENAMKPDFIHPKPDAWHFSRSDEFVKYAEEHGLHTVGHGLIWHKQTPSFFWFKEDGNPKNHGELVETMESYISTVAGRYSGRIHEWDVVMDALDENGEYHDNGWAKAFGDGYEAVRNAFLLTGRYAGDAELNYVDSNLWRESHLDGVIRMVNRLRSEGIRIDRIVMKGHWGLNYPDLSRVEAAIDTLSSMGLKVAIGELEVDVLPISREGLVTSAAFMEQQFQYEEFEEFLDPYKDGLPEDIANQLDMRYEEIFRMFYRHRDQIDRVTFWGITDDQSWKNDTPVPNRTNYTLLFNRDKSAKPALKAIVNIPGN